MSKCAVLPQVEWLNHQSQKSARKWSEPRPTKNYDSGRPWKKIHQMNSRLRNDTSCQTYWHNHTRAIERMVGISIFQTERSTGIVLR